MLLTIALGLAGCSTVSPQQRAALDEASRRYAGAAFDMTREQLVQFLGTPKKTEADRLTWEERFGRNNYESLIVDFNSANQVEVIRREHARFVWEREPTYASLSDFDQPPRPLAAGRVAIDRDVAFRSGYRHSERRGALDLDPPVPQFADKDRRFCEASFSHSWTVFEDACLAGNIRKIEGMCDGQVLARLPTNSLQETLGSGWKAEGMLTRNKSVIAPSLSHQAAARVDFEITENGLKRVETMWWIFSEKGWKCLNLPFQASLLPAEVRNPPAAWD